MRKQTKKVLSIVMSAALAITAGAGINLTKSSAKAESLQWTGSVSMGTAWSADKVVPKTDEGSTITLEGIDYNSLGVSMKVDLSAFENPTVTVTATADENLKEAKPFAVCNSDWTKDYVGNNKDGIAPSETQITGKLDKSVSDYSITAQGRTITKVVISDGDGSSDDVSTPGAITTPGAVETPAPEKKVPTEADLVGTAQLDSQANGWCGNDDCTNVKADIKGAGTYTVSSTWEEVQEDPQAYCAMTIADLKPIADYVTFSNVTVWVDGKVVDIPVIYGGDKDCRIQLWNTWGIPDNGDSAAGSEVPANFPSSFYEIKVQFTIGLRDTARDWDAEDHDPSLITMDTTQPDYEPANKPAEPTPADPTPAPADPTPAPTTPSTKNSVKTLKAAKKSVSVKKGKKANVTVKVTANNNKKKTTDKVTATSSNKKVAKVVKTTVKAGKIVVSVKGVKKGTAKITVKAAKKKAVVTVKVK